jgi:hypothetical protein
MSASRRDFMQQCSIGALGLAGLPALARPADPTAAAGLQTGAEWRALAERPTGTAAADYDVSWTARLTGKHRAVFDVPEIGSGSSVWRAGLWVQHYTEVLKASAAEIHPVIVIRHSAIPLALDEEFWTRMPVGRTLEVLHPVTDKRTDRNPVLMTAEQDGLPPLLDNLTLRKQIDRGAIVLACDMAFGRLSRQYATHAKLTPAEARAQLLTMLLPGITLQPNGIFGVILAQQNGCVFVGHD